MSFNAICENKIIMKISEFTVYIEDLISRQDFHDKEYWQDEG